jgi:hypothetical protein
LPRRDGWEEYPRDYPARGGPPLNYDEGNCPTGVVN